MLIYEAREERLQVLAEQGVERRAGRVATQDLGERGRGRP